MELWGRKPSCVLVVATGGGGDSGSAALLAEAIARYGVRTVVAAVPWERYVRDPLPGPVPLSLFTGVEPVGEAAVRVAGCCGAWRGGRWIVPSACRAWEALGVRIPVYLLEAWGGTASVARGVEEVASIHGCEEFIAFDVGGDILGCGCEEDLWSPLGDGLGLAALLRLGVGGLVAVHSPGADGELPEEAVLEYVRRAMRSGGYVWARGLSRSDVEVLEQLLSRVYTEAGRPALLAMRGERGRVSIRSGTRSLELNIVKTLTLFLDAGVVGRWSAARLIVGSNSLWEAKRLMNEAGVYTELDFEEDVVEIMRRTGRLPRGEELLKAKERRLRELKPCKAC